MIKGKQLIIPKNILHLLEFEHAFKFCFYLNVIWKKKIVMSKTIRGQQIHFLCCGNTQILLLIH